MIEAEVVKVKVQEEVLDFPCLMKSEGNDTIIIASDGSEGYLCGVVVEVGSSLNKIGEFSKQWYRPLFKSLPKGTEIKLKNK